MANETKACRDIGALLPAAQAACRAFLRECEREGLDVLITETYRTQERQDYLYAQGRTRAGTIITWTRKSRHTGRLAWDVCREQKRAGIRRRGIFRQMRKDCGAAGDYMGRQMGHARPFPF